MKNHVQTGLLAASLCALCPAAFAVDLTISSIEVNQAVQYGSTVLVGNQVTWVRVKVGITGSAGAVPGVDATLRLTIDGVQQPLPPIFSLNGPITAPLSPNSLNINDTINFAVIPPISNNVTFTVEVNPNRNPSETSYANNTASVTKAFVCRKMMEVAYVPINYTFNGAGLPPANLIEPGIGDGFLRGIYRTEWNYHKSPLPPLTWSSNVNTTDAMLQNTLLDIRNNQLPANGQPKPNFVFGFLPGNPYSGNGQANGIPGDVGFGNSDTTRHQRTMAHEIGHLFGRSHINQTINTIGVDVENQLKDTQNIPQIMPTTKNDIMVAGLLTNQAWVWQGTFDAVHADARMQCNAPPPLVGEMPVLRVSGVLDHATRTIELDPISRIASATPTQNDPNGDITILALDAAGAELTRISVKTGTARELCSDPNHGRPSLSPTSSVYVMIPETINDKAIQSIQVVDGPTSHVLARRDRSAHAPQVHLTSVALLPEAKNADGSGTLRVEWAATDADGDALTFTLLYSPDAGESWLPLVVNTKQNAFEYVEGDVPASSGEPLFRVVATDGLNVTQADLTAPHSLVGLGASTPPETFIISPNNGLTYPQKSPVAFHGTSWDKEDKLLTDGRLIWSSSIDGIIGTGMLFINSDLSPGTHVITLKGIDSSAVATTKSITVTISPRTILSADCNANGILDSVDIANGTSADVNANGIPDECETLCAADINHNNSVEVGDLLAIINAWGACPEACPPSCASDIAPNCAVDVADMLAVVNAWGACP